MGQSSYAIGVRDIGDNLLLAMGNMERKILHEVRGYKKIERSDYSGGI